MLLQASAMTSKARGSFAGAFAVGLIVHVGPTGAAKGSNDNQRSSKGADQVAPEP